jgi:hypothetical protein
MRLPRRVAPHNDKAVRLPRKLAISPQTIPSFLWDCHVTSFLAMTPSFLFIYFMRLPSFTRNDTSIPLFIFMRLPRFARNDTLMNLIHPMRLL